MKWIKVAIGAVIAILSVSVIATSVYGMTQEKVKEEVVTFEINLIGNDVTDSTYQLIYEMSERNEFGTATNNIKILYNGSPTDIDFDLVSFYNNTLTIGFISGGNEYQITILSTDIIDSVTEFIDNDIVEITFEVTQPPQLTGITATLILLTPLVLTAGIIYYIYSRFGLKED